MDVATLLLLGAAGGSLRAFVDFYNHTMEWRAARRTHRQLAPVDQPAEAPAFRDFIDPVPDLVAAIFHTALGAGAAAMFGSTGQIDGAYAAIAVGISAPALLTQLGQLQSVGDAVAGLPPPRESLTAAPAPSGPNMGVPDQQSARPNTIPPPTSGAESRRAL